MEPQIRYVRRQDGARTAYAITGHGPVMIVPPGFLSNLEWTLRSGEPSRHFWDALAQHRTLVLYDRHGCGLSDRKRTDFTAADDMLDLCAAVDASGAQDFDIFGISFGGSPAVRFAAEHPERVRRLIVWGSEAGLLDLARLPPEIRARMEAQAALRRSDHTAFMRLMATQMFPSGIDPETFRNFVRINDESVTVDMQEQLATVVFDNRSLSPQVVALTLVLHRRGDQMVPFAVGQFLARRLPNARFVPLDGDEHLPYFGDSGAALAPVIEFLREDDPSTQPVSASSALPSGTAVILFADIVDSTALTERMGDAAFRAKARDLDASMRSIITEAGGTTIDAKTLGDGVLATFPAASQAIDAALRCGATGDAQGLPLHLGLHAGDVIREQNNVFGGAVNIASRISGLSAPGEVLVSDIVRGLARTSAGVTFEDRGEHALKGVGDPQRVYAVRKVDSGS